MKTYTAERSGWCAACGHNYQAGEAIGLIRQKYGWMHNDCAVDLERSRGSRRRQLATVRDRREAMWNGLARAAVS